MSEESVYLTSAKVEFFFAAGAWAPVQAFNKKWQTFTVGHVSTFGLLDFNIFEIQLSRLINLIKNHKNCLKIQNKIKQFFYIDKYLTIFYKKCIFEKWHVA